MILGRELDLRDTFDVGTNLVSANITYPGSSEPTEPRLLTLGAHLAFLEILHIPVPELAVPVYASQHKLVP